MRDAGMRDAQIKGSHTRGELVHHTFPRHVLIFQGQNDRERREKRDCFVVCTLQGLWLGPNW